MKVYLAGPFFTKRERKIIEKVYKILKNKNLDIFAPMEHFIENGESLSNKDWGRSVFNMDVEAIDQCDIIVCIYYGMYSDTGTAWEVGYAYAKNKPIILIHVNSYRITSVMTTNSAKANILFQDLKHYNFNKLFPIHSANCVQK